MLRRRFTLLSVIACLGFSGQPTAFVEVGPRSRIASVLKNGATPEKHQIETMAGGVAVADFNSDGRPDIYFCNGARQPKLDKPDPSWRNRLYLNQGALQFDDVTDAAGVAGSGYHFGAAAADFDNDGHADLFVTGVPASHLYRNRGDGTFQDVTIRAGVSNRRQWPIAAGWFDFDNDGWLDLFVVNYVRWDPDAEPFCGVKGKFRTYCHPQHYAGLPNTLFRNNRDGTFSDVSASSGVGAHAGKGMGIAFADYDRDGDLDVFVANDTVPNFLFRNDGGGRFTEVSLEAGVGFNDDGRALSSMGVDFRDADNDGLDDLFVTALANETFPLFRNTGKGFFVDSTYPSRIGAATLAYSGWSAGMFDFDNDGWKDIFAANGDVNDNTEVFSSRRSRQRNLLLRNLRNGTYAADEIGEPALHRGAAFADFDGDGGVDVVVTRLNQPPAVFRNRMRRGHWIGFRLRGTKSNRDSIGARIHIVTAEGGQWNHLSTSVGYTSSSEAAVHFGLGGSTKVQKAEVRWPSGRTQTIDVAEIDRYVSVEER